MRDDIASLPIPPSAKRYARRSGLASMKRQPKDYINMVADIVTGGKKSFKNSDAQETTGGQKIGRRRYTSFKESASRRLIEKQVL